MDIVGKSKEDVSLPKGVKSYLLFWVPLYFICSFYLSNLRRGLSSLWLDFVFVFVLDDI